MKNKATLIITLAMIGHLVVAQSFTDPLTVTTNADSPLTFNNTENSWQYLQFKHSGTRMAWLGLDNLNNFAFAKEGGGDFYFWGGNLGILTDSPKNPLTVAGRMNVEATGDYYGAWFGGEARHLNHL